ncbi:MAG: LolA-related protein [Rhodoferax sp.]|nr:LolA-related protein [Rhodoferax sp.]
MNRTHWPIRPYSLLFAWLFATAVALPSHAADWGIDQLMHSLAQTRSGQARFVEKKTIAILDRPVESSGELLYTAPDRLEKRTVKPKPEAMVVDGDKLEIERGQQKIKLQLQEYPELAAFIDSIRGTLAGDRKALERSYQLSLEGSAQSWTLKLVPVDSKMKQVVALIRITGARDELRSIDVTQVDGDSSLMLIEKVAPR